MERRLDMPSNLAEMFGGIQPSRTAAKLTKKAISLGEDPSFFTRKAGTAAQQDGKGKVGFFGRAEQSLNALRDAIASIENRKAMDESFRRARKRGS